MTQTEKNPISIVGQGVNLEVTGYFYASSAKKKCKTKKGLVLTGKILSGKLITGEPIIFSLDGRDLPLADTVARIEKDKKRLEYAVPGDIIGICLTNTRLSQFKAFL